MRHFPLGCEKPSRLRDLGKVRLSVERGHDQREQARGRRYAVGRAINAGAGPDTQLFQILIGQIGQDLKSISFAARA